MRRLSTQVTFRARTAFVLFTAAVFFGAGVQSAAADYKLGDVATEDVVTPVPLVVVNPDATDVLKQKVAQQVHFIIRFTPHSAAEAEAELRGSIAKARTVFLTALQRELYGRFPDDSDLDTPEFAQAIRDVARQSPKDLPLEQLATLWVQGLNDEPLVEWLVVPVRQTMAHAIVGSKMESPLPVNQPVRLLPVKNPHEAPSADELENAGTVIPVSKVISLWRARRLVETYFLSGQQDLGRFAASFVRVNGHPDAALTEILRARKMEGVAANDRYEAGQLVLRKGQTVDRRAIMALHALREKSLIGTLQTKLAQDQSVAGEIKNQTKWIATALAIVCVAMFWLFWRARPHASTALALGPGHEAATPPGAGAAYALPEHGTGGSSWQQRALIAEARAQQAQNALRSGLMGWMREKLFRTLFRHRNELLAAQQKAEEEMSELEQRLEQLHTPLQERIHAYEARILELEKELAEKGEANRHLIGARIHVARQHLVAERNRGS